MDLHPTLWGILAITLAGFALVTSALPEPQPQAQVTVAPSPKVWVHVDVTTKGATITPTVTTYRNGDKSTTSAPPPYLTATKAYSSFKDDGVLTTYTTSLNPAPTALGSSGVDDPRGEFLACLPQQSLDEPFCAPKRDAILRPGRGYYITWNTLYFALPNQRVQILLSTADVPYFLSQNSSSSSSPKPTTPTLPHFSILPADQGFALLPLPKSFLGSSSSSSRQITRLNITMAVWASGNYDEDAPTETKQGPLVYVTNGYVSDHVENEDGDHGHDAGLVGDTGGQSKGKKIAISVPVAIVSLLVLGGLIAFAVWGYRKEGAVPWVGGLFGKRRGGPGGRGGGSGYGVRKSYADRVGGKRGAGTGVSGIEEGMITTGAAGGHKGRDGGVELADRESWSPTSPTSARLGGVNVFRAEMERQERARQG